MSIEDVLHNKKFKQPKPKSTLKAIDKLIAHYKKYSLDNVPPSYRTAKKWREECPLCAVHVIRDGEKEGECYNCPWYTIDSDGCMSSSFILQTTAQRLARLKRWKKKIQGGIICQLK